MKTLETITDNGLTLRVARKEDAALLRKWRNDPLTRKWSHSNDLVEPDEHRAWLERSLANTERSLFIALENDEPIGTVRADFDGAFWELS